MKHLKSFEALQYKEGFTLPMLRYKVGDFVKRKDKRKESHKIYRIKIIDDADGLYFIVMPNDRSDSVWIEDKDLFTDDQTEAMENNVKFNL